MNRTILFAGIVGSVVTGLTAIAVTRPDLGRCLATETETYDWLLPVVVGYLNAGTVSTPIYAYIPQTGTREVCTKWEFPEGQSNER